MCVFRSKFINFPINYEPMTHYVKISIRLLPALLAILFLIGTASDIFGQRNVSYRDLAMRNQMQQEHISFDFIMLPGDNNNTVKFTSVFNFSYDYLSFKKTKEASENDFYSPVNLSLEVFKANKQTFKKVKKKSQRNRSRRNDTDTSLEGLESAARTFWSDTAFAETYEQSQDNREYLGGNFSVSLKPGIYNYVLQLKQGDQTDAHISRTRSVRLESYDQMETGNFIYGQKLINHENASKLKLSPLGNSVEYANDFYALAYLPNYDSGSSYSINIDRIQVADKDTTQESRVFTQKITTDDIRTGIKPRISSSDNGNYVNLVSVENGFAYALVKIPNSDFQNALYRITVDKEGQKRPAARGTFRSLWIDMPTSLLNLDVAIDMLRFIVDDKTMDKLSSGSRAEREKKFREFWEKRDPKPETEFNELMAEYYRRIDYAYKNFTTKNTLGYKSDQGEVYIKFGPPENIERKYPTNGPTTEIWTYPNRKFVFRATTGFGDFKLVSDESK